MKKNKKKINKNGTEEMMVPGIEVCWTTDDWLKPSVLAQDVQPGGWSNVCSADGRQNVHFSFVFSILWQRG